MTFFRRGVRAIRGSGNDQGSEEPVFGSENPFFSRMHKFHGPLHSTSRLTQAQKTDISLHYQFKDKAECALAVANAFYGGDYFEFGAHDLNTFRNFLSAFDIFGVKDRFPDTRFYAFDIFGSMETDSKETKDEIELFESEYSYFKPHVAGGDVYQQHIQYIQEHDLFKDQCNLVQGFFQDTLNQEFKEKYRSENRKIGFAFIDVNMTPS